MLSQKHGHGSAIRGARQIDPGLFSVHVRCRNGVDATALGELDGLLQLAQGGLLTLSLDLLEELFRLEIHADRVLGHDGALHELVGGHDVVAEIVDLRLCWADVSM